jgi:uncharacterized membrane protein YozB (DUF420 family)
MLGRTMDAFLIAQINLIFQVIVAAVLLSGFWLKKRKMFFSHGTAMLVAVVLNAVSILLIMGPSLIGRAQFIGDYPLSKLPLVILIHAVLGSGVEALGIWIVAAWHFRPRVQSCARRKKIMRWTLVAWLAALSLGVVLYILIYVPF